MTSITPPTRPPAKRDPLRVAVRQLRFQKVTAARPAFLLAILALFLASVSVAHAQTTAPTVSTVAVTSNPGTDGGYAAGDTIEVGLTFDQGVDVSGKPLVTLNIGGQVKSAYYTNTSGTQLLFSYTVVEGDNDSDGIEVVANSLSLYGGTITSSGDSSDAALGHPAHHAPAHLVDGTYPEVEITYTGGLYVHPDRQFTVLLTFTEPVYDLASADFRITNGEAHDPAPLPAADQHPASSRWDVIIVPSAEGPIAVDLPADAVTDAFGNGNRQAGSPLSVIAADPARVNVELVTSGFTEGGTAEFLLTRSRDNGAIPVSVSVDEEGSFTNGTIRIYRASDPDTPLEEEFESTPATITVSFEAGELSKRVLVGTQDDTLHESDGSVTLQVLSTTGHYKYVPGWSPFVGSIVRDNDDPVEVSVHWLRPYETTGVLEGDDVNFVLLRTSDSGELTVEATLSGSVDWLDTANSEGLEHLENNQVRVVFADGDKSKGVYIATMEDSTDEADGSLVFQMSDPEANADYIVSSSAGTATAVLLDDDGAPTVTVSADGSFTEGEDVVITINRSSEVGDSMAALTVEYSLSQSGGYLADSTPLEPDNDGPVESSVTIPKGQLSATLRLETEDDNITEASGSVTLTILEPDDSSYLLGTPHTISPAVIDDELPTVSVTADESEVTEGDDVTFRFARFGNLSGSTTVGLYVGGHKKIMTDQTEAIVLTSLNNDSVVDTTVVFADGESEATLVLTTEADNKNEGDGQLTVRIARFRSSPYHLGTPSFATTLVKDDDIPTISIRTPSVPTGLTLSDSGDTWEGTVTEGDPIRFGIDCTGDYEYSEQPNHLRHYILWIQEMNHPGFYTPSKYRIGQNLLFPFYPISNCSERETSGDLGRNRRYTGPDEGEVRITLSPSDNLSPPIFAEMKQQYQQALEAAGGEGSLVTERGVFSAVPDGFTVRCNDELRFCPQYKIGTPNAIRLKVLNRDPVILIKGNSDEVTEGTPASFTVERLWSDDLIDNDTPGYSDTVVALKVTVEGDYVSGALPTQVSFGRNETSKTIEIPTISDFADTENGSVTVELLPDTTGEDLNLGGKYTTWQQWEGHTPDGGRSDRATVTILDDDEPPALFIAPATGSEGATGNGQPKIDFTVSLNVATAEEVTVDWATSDGTATAGADYTAATGTVTFKSGETSQTISVSLIDDSDDEPAETFIVTLSNPTNVEIVEGRIIQAKGTVEDDDLPTVTVAAKESEIEEGEPAVFVLTRTGDLTVDLSIRFPYRQHNDQTWGDAYFATGVATTEVSLKTKEDARVNYPSYREYEVVLQGDGSYGSGTDQVWKKGSPAKAVIKANDDDRLTVVTVEAEEPIVGAGEAAVFIYRRTGDLSESLTIGHLTFWHSSQYYSSAPSLNYFPISFTFGANEAELREEWDFATQGAWTMVLLGDRMWRGFHRIWRAGDPSSATVVSTDEALVLSTQVPATAGKGETVNIEFEVTNKLVEDTGKPIVITSDRSELTCTISDSISPGDSARCEGSLTITDEDASARYVTFSAFATDGANTSKTLYYSITVRDPATVGFKETGELKVPEGPGAQAELTVTVTGGTRGAVDVAFSLHPDPRGRNLPTPGLDYTDTSGVLTFASNQTEKTIIIPILEDQVDEPQESFEVRLTALGDLKLDPDRATRTVSIQDQYRGGTTDPYIPTMTLHRQNGGPVREDAGVVEFAVRLDRPSGHDIQGTLTTNNTGTAEHLSDYQMDPNDPTNGANSFRILSGATEEVVSIAVFDDEEEEGNETFPVVLNTDDLRNVKIGTPKEVIVTIADNDPPSEGIELDATPRRLTEEGGSQTVVISATVDGSALFTDTTIHVEDGSTGDAVAGVDYETFSAFDIVIPAYSTTTTHTFQIVVLDDYLDENQETISLVGSVVQSDEAGSGVGTLPVTGREIYIDDTDAAAVTVFPLSLGLEENGDGRTYTVVLATQPTDTVTVEVTVREATSKKDSDYMVVNPTRLTFTPRNWNEEQTVTVYAEDDGDADILTNTQGYIDHTVSGADYEGIAAPGVWIFPISETTVPELTVAPVRVSESAGMLEFTLTLNTATVGSVDDRARVDWAITGGTATGGDSADDEGADFKLPESGRTTFDHGATEATIITDLYDDDVDEPDEETIVLTLNSPHNAKFPGDASTIEVKGFILDDDPPPVLSVAGPGYAPYQVSETDGSIALTITLTGSHSRVVTVDYSTGPVNGGVGVRSEIDKSRSAEEGMDYAEVEGTAEFQPGQKTKTVTIPIINDEVSELTEFFGFLASDPANAEFARGATEHRTSMAILDNDIRRVEVTPISMTLDEGETDGASYTVSLSSEPTGNVTVDVTLPDGSEVSANPVQLTFTIENWGTPQTVTLSAKQDDDAVNDIVAVTHVITGADYQGTKADTVTVTVEDDDTQSITLSKTELTVVEGQTGEYTVKLGTQPTDEVTIAINPPVLSDVNVEPSEITFTADNWSTEQTVTVSADHDSDDEDDNAVLTHTARGADYAGLSVGLQVTVDDDAPGAVKVSFGSSTYTVAEGAAVTVTVTLDVDPERAVTIPLTATNEGGATDADYSGVPASVTFESGDTSKTFTFAATDDAIDDDDERVKLAFGTLPTGITAGTTSETVVSITDDDAPGAVKVSFGSSTYTVAEGAVVTVTVGLDVDPERTVTIPLTATNENGATDADYSGVPASVTFESGDTSKTFTFAATDDAIDDDDERVKLAFGTLPTGITAGTIKETLVSITDDDAPGAVKVSFGSSTYTVAEGAVVTVTVGLDVDPERTVTIPLTATNENGATDADYSGVPASVTFESGDTSKTFTFAATDDAIDDDDERVKLAFGTLPTGITAGTIKETLVSITDDDAPDDVKVSFGSSTYTVAEGAVVTVTVGLDVDPERAVTIPITATNEGGATDADYSGVPASVTFESGDTSKTFTFAATDDAIDDDDERVKLAFGTLPTGITAGTTSETVVSITDDDAPGAVKVSFGSSTYTVAEGAAVTVTVTLDVDPERTVTIPLTATNENGATDADYSGVPASVTFESGDTSKSFTFAATDDAIDDDDERVKLAFGTLPTGITAGTIKETLVSITDDDAPDDVKVSFGSSTYTAAEGGTVEVTVTLNVDPERTVTIPLTATNENGATNADYSGVPQNVTFDSGETSKSFTFSATDDAIDDDEERVELAFGTLPTGIAAGTTSETVVSITDDDAPDDVKVSFGASTYTVVEGTSVTVTLDLDVDPERAVTIPLTATNENGATDADYSGVPANVTFDSGVTSKSFTFSATDDTVVDDGESVQLSFGSTLPTGVTEGTPGTTTVSITDDDLAGDRLASLVVAPKDIDGFDPEVTDYMVGVTSTVSRATITATPAQTDSTITIDGTEVTAGSAHAVDLSTGLNTFEVVVTSADNDQTTYTVYVGRGTTGQGGWKAGDDLDTLRAAGNTEPSGIWSNGTTVWIADVSNAKLYAYSQADGARDGDKDIALGGAIMAPTGIWSDNTTIWVIGPVEEKLFAYTLGGGARDSDSDISLGSDLILPVDMWSDGVTMWVLDSHNDKLYAYPLSGEARDAQDSDKDIDLAGENAAPRGVWSNGTTIWVSDRDDRKLYAYNFSGERVAGHDIDLHSSNADAGAIWGNGDALWVANDINDVSSPFNRVFTYNNVAVTVTFEQSSYTVAESDDTSTSEVAENAVEVKVTLSADPKRQVVVPITATNLGNATGADYSGVPANLTFESGETDKSFTFTATDDMRDDDGESVQLAFGALPPGVSEGAYSEAVVSITDDDIGVSFERMGYETTEGDSVDVKVTLSSPATREVTIPLDADKQGGASDDDYSGVQDSITFRSSDTETSIKFTAVDDEVDDDGEKVRLRFGTLPTGLVPGANVEATITITDNDMPTDRLMSLVVSPKDIDGFDSEVTDYMVGVASTVTQATITATPYRSDDTVTIDGTAVTGGSSHMVDLSVGLNTFAVVVDSTVTQEQTTYTVYIGRGTTDQGGWKAGNDLDTLRSPGNTSPRGAWSNATTTWIADSSDGKLYAYTLADGSRDSDKDITLDSNNSSPAGIWSDNTTIWVAELMPTERKVYAYTLADGSPDSDKDITLRGGNTSSWGVWSDGTTMWVVDWNDDELYAYTLANDSRDSDKDITLHEDNTTPRGIWSDGTTIWVVDSNGAKLYAYALSDGVRVGGYDIGLHSSNAGAGGIWANDDTAWVVNRATEDGSPFDRVFTYNNIPVRVSFGQSTYAVAEGSSVTVKVTLSADPKRQVVIPLTATGQDGASGADYSAPASVTFESGQTTRDVTFTATEDAVDDDDETVLLGLGATLPAGVTPGSPATSTVAITDNDDPEVEVSFDQSAYDVAEGGDVTITVNLSADPERTVAVPLTATRQGGASGADYSVPATVTFDSGETAKTITFTATQDAIDDDGESVVLGFGALPDGVTPGTVPSSTVSIADDDAPASVAVSWAQTTYSVAEGGSVTVTAELDVDPERALTIPITATNEGGATDADYSGVPASVTFESGDTSKSFTFAATDDAIDDDDERVKLAFGTLPTGITAGTTDETVVSITDDDAPDDVKVSFGSAAYTAAEGGTVEVTVTLDVDPERTVTIPLTATNENGASNSDYSGVPANVTFDSGVTSKSFTFSATDDAIDDDDERVKLAFGTLPTGITAGTIKETLVSITDDDAPDDVKVSFGSSTYTVAEGAGVTVTVGLDVDPERTVTIPLTATNENGATNADYSGIPQSVTFESGDTSKTFTFAATDDAIDDDDERVKLAFGTLPTGVTAGTTSETVVSITDDDAPDDVKVSFGSSTYTVAEGAGVTVTVGLDVDPERTVTIPLTATNENGASNSDYSGVPANVTIDSGVTSKSFTFAATDDAIDDDGERVKLAFGTLPTGITAGTTDETVVSITDDDAPGAVKVSFGSSTYTVAEGAGVTVTVGLDVDPERTVTIPLTATNENGASNSDYSGVPANVTIDSGVTSKSFTFAATDDAIDDDDERVKLAFGTLPTGVTAGTTSETVVSITDDDAPDDVKVSFGSSTYTVAEGAGVTVTVGLDVDPERTVTIPLTATNENGASNSDYSGVPANVTFDSGVTSKSFTFSATDDTIDDDDERVKLAFGTLPTGITAGTTSETVVSITDDDAPASVAVSWAQTTYSVAEGGAVTVTAELDDDPEKTVIVPIARTHQGGASNADYSGVPTTITFDSGDTSKSFTFTAAADALDDDDESVQLAFGPTLPNGVTQGTPAATLVRITDNDDPQVNVSYGLAEYTAAEGGSVTVTVTLDADPERTVTIPLTATNENGATDADYSGVPASVTFESGDTSKSFTFAATDDTIDDDDERVKLAFGALPTGITAGTTSETVVSITDDDAPGAVKVSFGSSTYTVVEGASVTVTVTLDADPERTVTIPLTATNENGATDADYSGVPASVTFESGDTSKSFTFAATDDTVDDDDESVKLAYGALPTGITAGTTSETVVSITDDDTAGVTIDPTKIGVVSGQSNEYTLVLDSEPTGDVTVTISGHSGADLTLDKSVLTFTADDWDTAQSVKVTAAPEATAASVRLAHSVSGGDYGSVSADPVTVTIVEVSADKLTIQVGVTTSEQVIAVPEGGSNTYSLLLSSPPASNVTISVRLPSDNDLSIDLLTLTFTTTNWATPQTVTVTASEDDDAVTDDAVLIIHTMSSGGSAVIPSVRATITEKDSADLVITPTPLTVTEGDVDGATYTVALASEPTGDVTVTISGHSGADLSLDKTVLTFTADDWDTAQTVKVTAAHDDDAADDPETLTHTASGGDYDSLSKDLQVTITDDAPATVTVSFGADRYTIAEGGTAEVTVTLDVDPERTVTIPITATNENGATDADYSGVPANVTFESGDTSKTFTFAATDDAIDDDDERVKLAFGTLPTGITAGTNSETVVSITDDDLAATVKVRFDQSTYSATEGGDDAVVTVILDSPAKSQVEIPLTANGHGGATKDDWSGVPETVSFDTGDNSKSFTVTAFDDNVEDNGEMVELGFGTLPAGFAPGSPSTARITLMNDDSMGVGGTTGQNRVCAKGEITVRGQTDRWVWRITDSSYWDEYTIDLMGMHSNKGTLRDPHIVYTANIYTHDGFYPPGPAYGSFPSYASNDGGAGWDSSSRLRFRNRTGSYSYFPGKAPELDTGYYTALGGANPFGDGANGLGSYTLCIEGPGSISEVDQPERRIVVSAAHLDVSDGEPAQFNIKLGARPTGSVEVFMTKLEPASDSQYVVEPLMHNFTVDNWDIPQVVTVRRKSDYAPPLDDGFAIRYWGKGGGYDKEFEFLEVYDRVPRWMKRRLTYDPEPALTDQDSEAQKQNTPATGGPGISGTPLIGETLTATTSGIQDEDGLTDADFAYQWVRSELGSNSETDIAGATGSSYAVTSDDAGKAIMVRVTFTDDAGNEESLTSFGVIAAPEPPEAQVPGAPGTPDVSPHDSTSLAVSWTVPASDGGSAITGYKVQWKEAAGSWDTSEDVSEAAATGTSHTITGLTGGTEYSVRVLAINDIGEGLPSDDGSGTPRETVPPELSEASVDGAALTLAFNEALNEDSEPAPTAFTVTVGGNVSAVDSLEITGSSVILTLALAVTSSDQVSVSYAAPSDAAAARLEDLPGNPAASFADQAVTNNTAAEQQQNSPARGGPAISGTVQVGETLTASTSAISDTDGLTKVSYAYQWTANDGNSDSDIAGATARTYTLTAADVGKTIKVKVTFTDDAGIEESLPSAATAAVAANVPGAPARPSVSVIDTGKLDLSWQVPDDDGGSAITGYRVQWKEAADSWDTAADVFEATVTGTTHTITGLTDGVKYAVRVMATNDEGDSPASTVAKGTPVAENNTPTGLPTISGTAQVGETLTASTSNIDDEDGLDNVSYSYQWVRKDGTDDTDIAGETSSTYTLVDADQGQTIKVKVSFTDAADNDESLTSAATETVLARPNRAAAGLPTISGTPQVEQTLTADTSSITDEDGLTNVSYSYQWIAGGSDISGATGTSYTLTASEQGQTIQVRVTFSDDAGNEETLTSVATVAVAAAPNREATGAPTISGAPQVGQTLTADTSAIDDADGLTNVSYEYQWIAGGTDISGATASSYTLTYNEQGQTIQVRVTFTDDASNAETLASQATVAVAAAPNHDATGKPTIDGTPQVDETLTADTSNIDDEDGLTGVSYSYQWLAGGSEISGATGSSLTLGGEHQGQTIQVTVTFTDDRDNEESLTSAATVAVAAAPVPLTVSLKAAAPDSHNGSSEFTFEIEFSEEFGLSYKTLRDFAFTETGGEVRKAQRMDKPSNVRWLITVEPNGNGDVTIELPATTDCNAEGAICTGDGRMLSNSLNFTISGPGQ